jgi:transposase
MSKRSQLDLQTYYPDCLKIIGTENQATKIAIKLKSQKRSHNCPKCEQEMKGYAAVYKRTVQDLPIFMKQVVLTISAYEYRCLNNNCTVKSFVEDYAGFIGKSDRMTYRLENFIRLLALETSCEGAAMVCQQMGIKVSGDTVIRLLMQLADDPTPECSDTIGIDDFAYKKGQTYCTVICDEKTRKPIEILDGRDGKTLKEWLKNNKHVKRVTRDRAGAYAKAISEELPNAMQIADRFHLHQNLLTAVKEALKREIPNKIHIPNNPQDLTSDDTAISPESAIRKKKRV